MLCNQDQAAKEDEIARCLNALEYAADFEALLLYSRQTGSLDTAEYQKFAEGLAHIKVMLYRCRDLLRLYQSMPELFEKPGPKLAEKRRKEG